MNTQRMREIARLTALSAVLALGCGDDGGGGGDGDGAEPCLQAGMVQTGCMCKNGQLGSRNCQAQTLTWSLCTCPDPSGMACRDGDKFECAPCDKDGETRVRICMGGVVDCSCPTMGDGDGDSDAGGDGDGDGDGDSDAGGDSDGG